MTVVMWFRRDLRLRDHPALVAASASSDVVGLFVLDPILWHKAGPIRREWLRRSLISLNEAIGGRLWITSGPSVEAVAAVVDRTEASAVHISADFGVFGSRRDQQLADVLAARGVGVIATGSPYAVDPGRVTTGTGTRYRVYTPFYRAWLAHGWPAPTPGVVTSWVEPPAHHRLESFTTEGGQLSPVPDVAQVFASGQVGATTAARRGALTDLPRLPAPGEENAWIRWQEFREQHLADYGTNRNRPDLDGTSCLSAHLRFGEIHPRSLLHKLTGLLDDPAVGLGAEVFRKEIAWREFYAEVWHANPASTWQSLDPRFDIDLEVDTGPDADALFAAWAQGRTGFPFVDAGMRQLLATGWMHNRVRMVTASFLVKGLHLPWQRGAAHFLHHLRDGDMASNQHGWQWVAGCGTDAAPFHRIFNPTRQGMTFDPSGEYVRRWVPELRGIAGAAVHEPWMLRGTLNEALLGDYPSPVIDHGEQRQEALRRFAVLPPRSA